MLTGLEHVGVAVESLEDTVHVFRTLGFELESIEEVAGQKVRVALLRLGGFRLELLEPMAADGPLAKFLEGRGPGLHHLAFKSDHIAADLKELAGLGIELIDRVPRPGSEGMQVAFLHPRSTGRVLVELCGDLQASGEP